MVKIVLLCFQLVQHFLLMQPIEEAIRAGSFQQFSYTITPRISLHLDKPLNIFGYIGAHQFIAEFEKSFSPYRTERLEWISKQIDGDFAVQTLNLILWDVGASNRIYYKLVFFLRREGGQWRMYHLRGLAM